MDRPSKYHNRYYVGTTKDNKDGYCWSWNSSNEELKPTSTFKISGQHYCSYCCNEAYPIQARLKDRNRGLGSGLDSWYYETTGYCCICESAEQEKLMRKEIKELEEKQKQEIYELQNKYKSILKHAKKTALKMKYEYDLKELEWDEKHGIYR